MNVKQEIRTLKSLRADGGQAADAEFTIRGIAASYNSLSKDLGGFREKILPGAFRIAVASHSDVRCLFNHSADKVLGRTSAGTLTLNETPAGLSFVCQLDPNNTEHRNLHSSVKRGDIDSCSFAFSLEDGDDDFADGVDDDGKRCTIRSIRNVSNLFDVSCVTNPAYNSTSVQARSFASKLFRTSMPQSFEQQFIADHGFDPWLTKARAIRVAAEIRHDSAFYSRSPRALEARLAEQASRIAQDNIDAGWRDWKKQ